MVQVLSSVFICSDQLVLQKGYCFSLRVMLLIIQWLLSVLSRRGGVLCFPGPNSVLCRSHVLRSQCWGFLNVLVPLLVARFYLLPVVVLVQGVLLPCPQKIFNCIRFEIGTQNASSPFPRHSVCIFSILPAGTMRLTGVLGKVFIVPASERGAQEGGFVLSYSSSYPLLLH